MRTLLSSAARRIALGAFAAYSVSTLLLGLAVFSATHAAFSRQIELSVEQTTTALLAEYHDDGINGLARSMSMRKRTAPITLGTALYDPAGRRIAGDLDAAEPGPGWQRISFFDPLEGPDHARAKVTPLAQGYRLAVAADLEDLEAIDHAIVMIFAAALAAALAMGVVGAVALARWLRGKLAPIENTASAIVAGDLARRAPVGLHGDEFDRVASAVNLMLDKNSALIANLRQVSADLSHDLRTPLAALRNHLEQLGPTGASPEQIDVALARTDDVLALFEAILRISEVEEGSLAHAFANIDLAALLSELTETLGLLAEEGGQRLKVSWQPGLCVAGDRQLLAQLIINLIENAMKHTPPGTLIQASLTADAGTVVLKVRDNGPGIAEADRAQVLRRFVRLEASRHTPGHGLGLSLVSAIAQAHRASLVLGDAVPGLVVTLRFPGKNQA